MCKIINTKNQFNFIRIQELQGKISRANGIQDDLREGYKQREKTRGLFSKGFEMIGFKDDIQEQRKTAFSKNVQLLKNWNEELASINAEYEKSKDERKRLLFLNAVKEAQMLEIEIKERPLSEFQAAFNEATQNIVSRAGKEQAEQDIRQ